MKQTKLMGVVNLTPNSFSDGGRFKDFGGSDDLMEVVRQMILDGAEILDLGGESTGPGSQEVTLAEEMKRVLPAILKIREEFPLVLISVDTWKSVMAEAALDAGANWINDVTAGRGDPRIFEVAARHGAPMILMYSKQNTPRTDKEPLQYDDVMVTVKAFLAERVAAARAAGVSEIIIDPGMGAFVSGDPKYSFEILDRIEELEELGCPILVGTSRKSFLGEDRLGMTLWTTLQLRGKVDFLRVHDVYENATVAEIE